MTTDIKVNSSSVKLYLRLGEFTCSCNVLLWFICVKLCL